MPFLENEKELFYWESFNPAFPFQLKKTISPWSSEQHAGVLIITDARYLASFPAPYEEIFRAKDTFENKETVLIRQLPSLP